MFDAFDREAAHRVWVVMGVGVVLFDIVSEWK